MDLPVTTLLIFIAALSGLVISSYYFVGGAAALARFLGMTPGLIGLTIVAFGTSAPEILVSAGAAMEGTSSLGVGNALGSNIANVGLVLALTTLVATLPVQRGMFRLEIPILIAATTLAALFLSDFALSKIEGAVLLACALAFPFILVVDARRHKHQGDPILDDEESSDDIPDISQGQSWLWLMGGLGLLLFSADQLVDSATNIAHHFDVSPLVIGVTIVAIGTSLPELATSIMSAIRGHKDMAIGNIIGSNILNIFAVMAMPGLIYPSTFETAVFNRDTVAMVLLTVVLLISLASVALQHRNGGSIGWKTGLTLLAIYIAYTATIIS